MKAFLSLLQRRGARNPDGKECTQGHGLSLGQLWTTGAKSQRLPPGCLHPQGLALCPEHTDTKALEESGHLPSGRQVPITPPVPQPLC